MPFIEINGKKVEAEAGSMIIEVADLNRVQIPRFCYHKKLSIAANCRMCLVEVEKAPKPMPACATPVTEGMKIWTHSPKALLAQKAVMEFLLINHPLDCPICDQGGECELQDLSLGFGADDSRFTEAKRVIKDKDIGPLIATNMTRCIHCTRCVRFGSEIAGIRELGATGRGECTEIGTFIEKSVVSEVSGNIIDLCPVGALTSKPFEYSARGWELRQAPSIAPHDNVGSHIYVHSRRDAVMRVVPRENELGNEIWISDRDRFSYEALNHESRLLYPKIKQNGTWVQASWDEALLFVVEEFKDIVNHSGPNALGGILSPNSTLEEAYLLQKLIRGLASNNIDHRLRQQDFSDPVEMPIFPSLGCTIADIEQQETVLLVGSWIRKEQPILSLKLRKMVHAGGKVCVINPLDFSFNFEVALKSIVAQGDLVLGLARVAKAVLDQHSEKKSMVGMEALADIQTTDIDIQIAKQLIQGPKTLILIGMLGITHPEYSQLIALANIICELTSAKVGVLSDGANTAGAWIAGAVPHRLPGGQSVAEPGLNVREMWDHKILAYVLLNIEPEYDCIQSVAALNALQRAKCVLAITPYESTTLKQISKVMLPMCPFTETSGTYVNVAGLWQSFKAVVKPKAESRPAWKILRALGTVFDLTGFEQNSSEEVLQDLSTELSANIVATNTQAEWRAPALKKIEAFAKKRDIVRIAPMPLHATDNIVRRAAALQKTEDAGISTLHLNGKLAQRLALKNTMAKVSSEGISLTLPFLIDETIPDDTVLIAAGLKDTVVFRAYATVAIENI